MPVALRFRSVFSAHAEVVPHRHDAGEGCRGILRARGGSSQGKGDGFRQLLVFSAHAEVVPWFLPVT